MKSLSDFWTLFRPPSSDIPGRRYDLDWMRVLAFGLLIFYHIGMLYVENWGYHIKSQYLSSNLESVMLLVNPWRMPILWIISGIAIRFILAKITLLHFIKWRSYRLLLPLLFGILVVVPPQLYYEMTQNGDLNIGYWQFYKEFFSPDSLIFDKYQPGIWPHIDVNHLWYLRELWQFSLFIIILLPIFHSNFMARMTSALENHSGVLVILIITTPVLLIQIGLDGGIERKSLGFLFLCYGYLLGWNSLLWQRLKSSSYHLLMTGIILYCILAVFYNMVWITKTDQTNQLLLLLGTCIHSLDRIIWTLAILALGHRFLNKGSKTLSYLNEAVYPYYILHQSIIVTIGYEISQYDLGSFIEPILVSFATFFGCALGFELIRRLEWLRPFFGLKLKTTKSPKLLVVFKVSATILVVGLGLEILI